ncbi:hypothetical protein HK096_001284, partial [Nowakowskiella sp. JEL0078]
GVLPNHLLKMIVDSQPTIFETILPWSLTEILASSLVISTTFLFEVYQSVARTHSLGNFHNIVSILLKCHLRDDVLLLLPSIFTVKSEKDVPLLRTLGLVLAYIKANIAYRRNIDFQLLLPSILISLQSKNLEVRKLSFACLKSIALIYEYSKGLELEIHGKIKMFGAFTKNVIILKTENAKILVENLVSTENDVLSDPSAIKRAVMCLLSGKSQEKFEDRILNFLTT